jgi:hypothetical protein
MKGEREIKIRRQIEKIKKDRKTERRGDTKRS